LAASVDYVLSGDPAAAKTLVESTLRAQGFELESTPLGGLIAMRGISKNAGTGFWAGIFGAGQSRASFIVEFSVDAESRPVVRWNGMASAGIITGRFAGESPTNAAFHDTADALSQAFTDAGVLTDTIVLS
jgi:hypothetical protein